MPGFDISVILGALPFLAKGLGLSLGLTAVAMAGGLALGLVIAVARLSRFRVLATLAALYVNGFRAVPLILVIFWFYFLVPLLLGRPVGALYSVLIALRTSMRAARRAGHRAASTPTRPATTTQMIRTPHGIESTSMPWLRSERCNAVPKSTPSTTPRIAPNSEITTDSMRMLARS